MVVFGLRHDKAEFSEVCKQHQNIVEKNMEKISKKRKKNIYLYTSTPEKPIQDCRKNALCYIARLYIHNTIIYNNFFHSCRCY